MLLRRLVPELSRRNVIPDHQFGFRSKHATTEQVHRVCEKIRASLENKEYCSTAFLDIQQAFDTVWHRGLLFKIKSFLPHTYFALHESYLADRFFQVKESDARSSFYDINAGVPQGSVLGPTLYSIYTSDLPQTDNVVTATYADDTAVLASHSDHNMASLHLQEALDKITSWMNTWRIRPSATKSTQVTFTLRQGNCPPVKLAGSTLPHVDSVKYLGMHLDRRLTWKTHIKAKRDELNIRFRDLLWLLGRQSKLSLENKLLVYKAVLRPVWTYGVQLWGCASNSNIEILQRFQTAILKTISNAPWFITNYEVYKLLGMTTIQEEIAKSCSTYKKRLNEHPNQLAQHLLQ